MDGLHQTNQTPGNQTHRLCRSKLLKEKLKVSSKVEALKVRLVDVSSVEISPGGKDKNIVSLRIYKLYMCEKKVSMCYRIRTARKGKEDNLFLGS